MADLTITAASVVAGGNAVVDNGVAGAAITAGQVVYKAADGTYKLADNNLAGAEAPTGIALNGAAIGQRVAVQTSGKITIGATLTAGSAYCLSSTAGGICPVADLTTGNVVVQLGLAVSTTVLDLKINAPGVTL